MQSWRLAAQEIEDCVIGILVDALTSPARLLERLGAPDMPSDQNAEIAQPCRPLCRDAPKLAGRTSQDRTRTRRAGDNRGIIIKMRRGALLGEEVPLCASEEPSGSTIELKAAVDFKQRGAETKLVLAELSQQNQPSRCDPTLLKVIARGREWFEELATGRARSLRQIAERDGITRRYIRRLVDLAFLSPRLVEAILQGRQPVELTATRLTELDLPLDWAEQHRLLAS